MIVELELYKKTRIFKVSVFLIYSTTAALLLSIPVVNQIGVASERFVLPIVILSGMSVLMALVVKKYYVVGVAYCDRTSLDIRLTNGQKYGIEIKDVLFGKIGVLSYWGRSAGLTGLTASGVENLILLRCPAATWKFYYYIDSRNERNRLQAFFNGWKELNSKIEVAY